MAEVAWWCAASCGVWLITLSSVSGAELLVALSCGLVCGLAARGTRRTLGGSWRPSTRWTLWLLPLVVAVLADSGRLVQVTLRSLRAGGEVGHLKAVRLPETDPDLVFNGREAVGTVVMSATPASIVVNSDPRRRVLTVHSLVSGKPAMEEVIQR